MIPGGRPDYPYPYEAGEWLYRWGERLLSLGTGCVLGYVLLRALGVPV